MAHGYINGKAPRRIDDIPISWVFVDLEGVLANLATAIFEHLDRPSLIAEPWPAGATIEDRLGVTKKYMFDLLIRDSALIWKKVKPYPWARNLLTNLRAPRVIVTGGRWGIGAITDKWKWCERHVNGKFSDLVVIQHRHLLAGREALLIDDHAGHTERFKSCGGHSLLFPQPWNAVDDTSSEPDTVLDGVMGQIRCRYLCAAVPETQARDTQYGQFASEFT
jgi:hypothetical protein